MGTEMPSKPVEREEDHYIFSVYLNTDIQQPVVIPFNTYWYLMCQFTQQRLAVDIQDKKDEYLRKGDTK